MGSAQTQTMTMTRPARALPLPPAFSIVIPALNEEARLGPTLLAIARHLESRQRAAEVVVVDDGSTDTTAQVAEGHAELFDSLRVIRHTKTRGKGAAVRTGLLAARGALVLYTDANLRTPIDELDRLLPALRRGAHVVVGTRDMRRASARSWSTFAMRFGGRAFATIAAMLVPTGVRDTQCGFKLFQGAAARELARMAEIDGVAFDVELLALARQMRFGVAEVVVRSVERRRPSLRHVRMLSDSVLDLVRIRRRISRHNIVRLPDIAFLRG